MNRTKTSPMVEFLEELQKAGGLTGADIADFTGVSKATVSRWQNGMDTPSPKNQLILSDLAYVIPRLGSYYEKEEVRTWLFASQPQLSEQRAIDLMRDRRTEEVIVILDRLDADAYI